MLRHRVETERTQVAHAIPSAGAIGANSGWIDALRAAMVQRIRWFAAYRATYDELSRLTDRDLADIGLSRAALHAVSRQAAYDAVL